ncbi:hypothetical protein L209DRAFT_759364 [Thermothelomyces heterothallicus CBS 203.75]
MATITNRRIERAKREASIALAINALNAKKVYSIRQAAKLFNVPASTLRDRFTSKRKENKVSKQHLQRLTPAEEKAVVKAVYQLDA